MCHPTLWARGCDDGCVTRDPGADRSADPRMPDMPRDPERSRGRYGFTLDGAAIAIDERFVLGEIAPGVVRVRTTRVSARPTSRLESDVRVDADGMSVALRWAGSGLDVVREATAELLERQGTVVAGRVVEGLSSGSEQVPGRIDALAHVVAGPLMLAALDGVEVVAPDVVDPADPVRFLAPSRQRWRTAVVGADSVVLDGEERAGTAYSWVEEVTGREGVVTVDAGGLILRTVVAASDGRLEVVLREVTGAWPTPSAWGR